SLSEPEELKGRSEQLRDLHFGFAAQGSFLVTGQKRVGKTSLVRVFLRELQTTPRVLPVYIPIGELQAVGSAADLAGLGRDLSRRIAEQFEERFGTTPLVAPPPLVEFEGGSFNATFTRFIRQSTTKHAIRHAPALDDLDAL